MRGNRLKQALLLAVLAVPAASCASAPLATPESVTFAPQLGLYLPGMERRESGLYVQDVRLGEGEAVRAPQRVGVYYVGWLPDGTQFDNAAPPAEPYTFRLGAGQVIHGWEEGVTGMRPGGQRLLVVPARLGYARERSGAVPPNAVLVFLIELVEVG